MELPFDRQARLSSMSFRLISISIYNMFVRDDYQLWKKGEFTGILCGQMEGQINRTNSGLQSDRKEYVIVKHRHHAKNTPTAQPHDPQPRTYNCAYLFRHRPDYSHQLQAFSEAKMNSTQIGVGWTTSSFRFACITQQQKRI